MKSIDFTLLHVYASSAVHSDCDVGFDKARIIGFCILRQYQHLSLCDSTSLTKPTKKQINNKDFHTS